MEVIQYDVVPVENWFELLFYHIFCYKFIEKLLEDPFSRAFQSRQEAHLNVQLPHVKENDRTIKKHFLQERQKYTVIGL